MTRLVVLQHLQREGPGLFALVAARRGWPLRPEQLELWLQDDRDYVLGALGPGGVERIRADAACWAAEVAGQGERLIANLLDQLTVAVACR